MRSPSRLLVLVFALAGSALLAAVLSWLWSLSQENWPASGEHPPFPYLFAGIFLASALWSTQAGWRGWFGRLLQWDTQSYEAARHFGRRLSGTIDLNALTVTIAQALVDELQLVRAAVWLWQPATTAYLLAAEAGESASPFPRLLHGDENWPEASRPLRLYSAEEAAPWLEPLRQSQAIDVLVPLMNDNRRVGLLGLGHRWDEEIFDDRDLAIAELVGQQATLFLLAAMQVEELRRVPERIVAVQEGERRRLAAELHDTVQQFFGGLPFALGFTLEEIRNDPEGVVEALNGCLDDVESMAETVRRIRFNLAPSQLESSLSRSLEALVAHVERRAALQVTLTMDSGLDEATTLATREALYRVIQQALDNVIAHAQAHEVWVRLECTNGMVTFSLTDNGRGSTEAERQEAAGRGRYGLSSMRDRLVLCGGAFAFVSMPGSGTTVSGWVPAGDGAPGAAEK
jgi:signal transduction histidine kinase